MAAGHGRAQITCMEEILTRKVIVEPQILSQWLVVCELLEPESYRACEDLQCHFILSRSFLCLLQVHDSKDKPAGSQAQHNHTAKFSINQ